jgi:hypothetical protein
MIAALRRMLTRRCTRCGHSFDAHEWIAFVGRPCTRCDCKGYTR